MFAVCPYRYLDCKPIVRAPPPSQLGRIKTALPKKRKLSTDEPTRAHTEVPEEGREIPKAVIDKLCEQAMWTSTSRRTQEDTCIPIIPVSLAYM